KDLIEDSIMDESFRTGDQVPSTNALASFSHINPASARKGMSELLNAELLVKKRGMGMCVTDTAQQGDIEKRKQRCDDRYMLPLKEEAKKLQKKREEIIEMLQREDY